MGSLPFVRSKAEAESEQKGLLSKIADLEQALVDEGNICSIAVCCSVLQYVAVCCSVLQCVAVCFDVLQCVAV